GADHTEQARPRLDAQTHRGEQFERGGIPVTRGLFSPARLCVCASVRLVLLHSAGPKHRRMVTALQQVVQHLVLHELAVGAPAVREVDSVRGMPPSVAAALVSGTGIVRPRYLVPVHAIEFGPETGALFYRGP